VRYNQTTTVTSLNANESSSAMYYSTKKTNSIMPQPVSIPQPLVSQSGGRRKETFALHAIEVDHDASGI
jgi:hypothetical protein